MNIAELAQLTGATLEGDDKLEITSAAGLDIAAAGQVTFLANPRYRSRLASTRAGAVIVGKLLIVAFSAVVVPLNAFCVKFNPALPAKALSGARTNSSLMKLVRYPPRMTVVFSPKRNLPMPLEKLGE